MSTNDSPIPTSWNLRDWKLHGNLTIAILAQMGCWYCASPFPQIGEHLRTPESGVKTVLVAYFFLMVFPAAWLIATRQSLKAFGWGLGKIRLGLTVFATVSLGITGIVFVGGADPEIQRVYPWVGSWLGESALHCAYWFPIYALYYWAYESFYRGFLLMGLEKDLGAPLAMWVQAIGSATIHYGKPPIEALASIPAAFLFGCIARRTQSIWYVFGIHFVVGIGNDLFSLYHQGKLW